VKRFRKRLLCTLVVLVSFGVSAMSAEAGSFMPGPTGSANITYNNAPIDSGSVSFSVYQNNDGGAGLATALGTTTSALTTAGVDLTAKYVYLYQVVNTGSAALSFLQIDSKPSLYTSAGQIGTSSSGSVFSDGTASTNVVGTTNGGVNYLGSQKGTGIPFGMAPTTSETYTGQTAGFSTANGGVVSSGTRQSNVNGYTQFLFEDSGGDPTLAANSYSYLLFLTSNNAPTLGDGQLHDQNQSDGYLPMASAPEPTSMAMMGLGVFGLGGWAGWRRRFRKTSDLS